MKQFILTIAVSMISLFSYSQQLEFNVYQLTFGYYSAYTNDYKKDETNKYPNAMSLYYRNGVFMVTDEAQSNYRVTGFVKDKGDDCKVYNATDEKEREVVIMFCASANSGMLTVIYPQKYYITYYIKP